MPYGLPRVCRLGWDKVIVSSVESIAAHAATHELRPKALAVIGSDTKITGSIETTNKILIEGEVLGDVRGSAVFVNKLGRITGGIVAEEVVVSGVVLGSIRGRHVLLESSSHVEGDVFHESLLIVEGAAFQERLHRSVRTRSPRDPEPFSEGAT